MPHPWYVVRQTCDIYRKVVAPILWSHSTIVRFFIEQLKSDSEGLIKYLTAMGSLHSYSFGNILANKMFHKAERRTSTITV
jgi:hypothetical protein